MKKVLSVLFLASAVFSTNALAYRQCDYSGGGAGCYGNPAPQTCTVDSFGTTRCY